MLNESIPEVIAHLDEFERELMDMTRRIREYRYVLFSAYAAEGLDTPDDSLLD